MDFVRIDNVYIVKSVQVLLFSLGGDAQICNEEKDTEINKDKYVLLAPTLIPRANHSMYNIPHGIGR